MRMQLISYVLHAIATGEPLADSLVESLNGTFKCTVSGYHCEVDALGNAQPAYFISGINADGEAIRTAGIISGGFEPCETLHLDDDGKPVIREPWPHGAFVVDEEGKRYYL